ncbi:hypothetical protein Taro_017077 [Colocasia esculenta]|uniref:DDE Tnp4 domain-containing protein n=1 Tax=Colocasia esculenta TaxID=4460 RepID=A0A843UQ98_COLES|nr:hypothetical protein [Colocasia esculenta]
MATSRSRSKGKGKIEHSRISALEKIADLSRERNAMLEKVFAKELGEGSNNVHSTGEVIPSIQQIYRDLRDMPNLPYRVYLKSMNLFTDPNMRMHSSQTISHYVNKLAIALASLKDEYILQPTHTNEIHPHIAGNERFYPFFKNAIGAIDGTHIPANLPIEDHPRFRNRKQQITQNVMAVVSFDGLFVYACVGWEGSAPDMKVLRWAVSRQELVVPIGKYYLVDAGYANTDAFIAPYRGVRYHISSFRRRGSTPYENKKDKFNHRHAQLRNCVERAFGVMKMRFQTLRKGNMYPFSTQKKIVFACLVIHNFVRREYGYDDFFNQALDEHSCADDAGDDEVPIAMKLDATAVAARHAVREAIADELWAVGNRLAEDNNPVVAAAACKAIDELRRQ